MGISSWAKKRLQTWLEIVPPPAEQAIVIQREHTREMEVIRSQLWYNGDANELFQFFHQTETNTGSFWGTAPQNSKIRKIHSGLPAVIADTLAYIVKSDMDDINAPDEWEEVSEKLGFSDLVGQAITDTLVSGDGAFKISVDSDLSPYPLVEFVSGDRVEIDRRRGIIESITIKTPYVTRSSRYTLYEKYTKGRVESELVDSSGSTVSMSTIPELEGIQPVVTFDGDYMLAIPMMFYTDKKYRGRGRSIFAGGKSQCFDALDEIISQWVDAIRSGRVVKYIPESLIPRDPKDGSLMNVSSFGAEVIKLQGGLDEGTDKVDVCQPDIKYDAYVSSYTQAMLMCLQGIISPATLGIDVGKMSSGEAQREKKDVTGDTRNTITAVLERVLPQLINAILMTADNMRGVEPKEREDVSVTFGEYGAPDFDSRVETVGKAATYGIMSTQTQVDELWGGSQDDEWKAAEVARIKAEKGIMTADEPSVGGGA